MQSRKEDKAVHAREMALQAMDLAYHKYKEIVRNLEEGLKVSIPLYADVFHLVSCNTLPRTVL